MKKAILSAFISVTVGLPNLKDTWNDVGTFVSSTSDSIFKTGEKLASTVMGEPTQENESKKQSQVLGNTVDKLMDETYKMTDKSVKSLQTKLDESKVAQKVLGSKAVQSTADSVSYMKDAIVSTKPIKEVRSKVTGVYDDITKLFQNFVDQQDRKLDVHIKNWFGAKPKIRKQIWLISFLAILAVGLMTAGWGLAFHFYYCRQEEHKWHSHFTGWRQRQQTT